MKDLVFALVMRENTKLQWCPQISGTCTISDCLVPPLKNANVKTSTTTARVGRIQANVASI